jgi:electron transport complex protein RnfC
MLECPDEVLLGAELLRRALGVLRAVIAVEADKLDAARLLAARAAALGLAPAGRPLGWRRGQTAAGDGIFIAICRRRYPQGSEKQLVKAVLGREVPSGKLPVNVGAVVNNVGTAGAACRILRDGQPVVDRVLTVAGRGVKRPGNYRARIGTPIGVLLDAAGARPAGRSLVVLGGPMMGKAACSLDTPVAKGTAGVLLLDEPDREAGPCIRCGRCAEACPMGLEPWRLELLVGAGADEASFAGQLRDCLECGSCAWGCPARRPLLEAIRLGKARFARKA